MKAIFVVSLGLASYAMYDLYRKTQAELRWVQVLVVLRNMALESHTR